MQGRQPMLGTLQGKVEAKGEKEKQLFDENMCYCKNVGGDLAKSMTDAKKRGPELTSVKHESDKVEQLQEEARLLPFDLLIFFNIRLRQLCRHWFSCDDKQSSKTKS